MNWQQFFQQVFPNLQASTEQAYELADDLRRDIMFIVLVGGAHLGVLILVHSILMLLPPHYFSPWNSIWGVVWVMALCLVGVLYGGMPVQGPFLGMLIPQEKVSEKSKAVARVITAFVAIEFLVNTAFVVIPFFASISMFLALLSPMLAFVLLRWLDGKEIAWGNWVTVVKWNLMAMGAWILFECFYPDHQSLRTMVHSVISSIPAPLYLAVALLVVGLSLPRVKEPEKKEEKKHAAKHH